VAAYYVKYVKRTFVKILSFLYNSIKNHIALKSLGLGVYAVCSAEWDWTMLCVVEFVICLPPYELADKSRISLRTT
jgi:hypothetical protein